ncbi:uncharacterized protein LOC127881601 isoform X2 [Dreissena polymorpha]|uniref:uncharacterized protein LOC127881601 isoform X2 n=1 Tax=Dreissena polymorpha TaxID=45954 RepID=UPI0022655684|nr:uncharacterized protein LOC127881601 isoform X2 [Dreissena polymorpha]
MSTKMNAKQRAVQKVKERLRNKLDNLLFQKKTLYSMVDSLVSEAREQTEAILSVKDTGNFLQRYSGVEQHLDMVYNTCELLVISAEDLMEPDVGDPGELSSSSCKDICKDTHEHLELPQQKLSPLNDVESVECEAFTEAKTPTSLKVMVNEDTQTSDQAHSETGDSNLKTGRTSENKSARALAIPKENCDETQENQKLNSTPMKSLDHTPPDALDSVNFSHNIEANSGDGKTVILETTDKSTESKDLNDSKKDVSSKQKKSRQQKPNEVPKNIRDIFNEMLTSHLNKGAVKEYKDDSGGVGDVDTTSTDASGLVPDIQKLKVQTDRGISDSTSSSRSDSPKKSPQKGKPQKKGKMKWKTLKQFTDSIENQTNMKCEENKSEVLQSKPVESQPKETVKTKSLDKPEHSFEAQSKETAKMKSVDICEQRVECKQKDTVKAKSLSHEQNESFDKPALNSTETRKEQNEAFSQPSSNFLEANQTVNTSGSLVVEVMKGQDSSNVTSPVSPLEGASKHCLVPDTLLSGRITHASKPCLVPDTLPSGRITPASKPCLVPDTLPSGRITPVVVSEMVSPWCFFLNKNSSQLPELMEQIWQYMQGEGEATGPLLTHPEIGTMCLARYSKDLNYYRAYIMQTYTAGRESAVIEVDVLYVDYGNRERLKITDLRLLPDKFCRLPSQAICCALAEVMPRNKYCVWTDSSLLLFRQYVLTNQLLNCTVTCRSSDPRVPMLVDLAVNYPVPSSQYGGFLNSQISVSTLLINAGLAKQVAVSEQISLLAKSGEAAEMAAILSSNVSTTTSLAITELPPDGEQSSRGSRKSEDGKKGQTVRKDARNKAKEQSKTEADHKNIEIAIATTEHVLKVDSDGKGQKVEDPLEAMVTPRSENSETESQEGEVKVKVTDVKSQLGRIKEELDDAEGRKDGNDGKAAIKADTGSVSSMSDLDLTSLADLPLDDMTFDLDNLHLGSQGQEVMLAHIRSPGEFYVHIISQKSGQTLDLLMKNLNARFEEANRRKLMNLSKTFVCEVGKLCCAQFTQDDNFYRGVIKSVKPENQIASGRVLVHYIDFGDQEWLPKRRIYPLPAQFASIPRMALKCSLSYIVPMETENDGVVARVTEGGAAAGTGVAEAKSGIAAVADGAGWSEKAIEEFIKLGGMEKTLTMHIVQGTVADQKDSYHDSSCSLKVMLVDNTGPEEVCINLDLIRANLAKLCPDKGSALEVEADIPQAAVQEQDELQDWNPMEEDFLSSRNKYDWDRDDVGVATTGHKARDDRICKFYSRGRNCYRGEACPYRHIDPNSAEPVMRGEAYAICDNQEGLIPAPGSWVAMEISTILTPARFYSLLPMGVKSLDNLDSESSSKKSKSVFDQQDCDETLDDLQDALNVEYSKRASSGGSEFLRALGEIVAARFSQDRQWYRARVIEVDDSKVRVFYLDFGNTEWLPETELCDILPEFLHLPFQALECFLDNIHPTPPAAWSKDAVQYFRELVDGKTLVAHIKARGK